MNATAYRNWNVTATYGEQVHTVTVYAKDRAQALKFARNDVAAEMPFYKHPDDRCRVSYRATVAE